MNEPNMSYCKNESENQLDFSLFKFFQKNLVYRNMLFLSVLEFAEKLIVKIPNLKNKCFILQI